MAAQTQTPSSNEWWSAFPAPRANCQEISAEQVMKRFDDMDIKPGPRAFLLVDVRRTDWEGGTITTSLNLPAQSFYHNRKPLFELCDRASVKQVIFYCGSSSGRGPRCANWMQDYIDDISKFGRKTEVKPLVLKGGIKNWIKEYEGAYVEGYEEKYWEQFK